MCTNVLWIISTCLFTFSSWVQAPPTVHYIPNFITAEEADYLWRQVSHSYTCISTGLTLDNTGLVCAHITQGVCCSYAQMDTAL